MLIDYNVDDLMHSLGGNRGDKILYRIYAHIYICMLSLLPSHIPIQMHIHTVVF